MLIISNELLEWVILILLIGALFHFIKGDAENDIKQNCYSLAVEDNAFEKPVVVDIVNELMGLITVHLYLIIVETCTIFHFIAGI